MVKRMPSVPVAGRRRKAIDTAVRLHRNGGHQVTVVATVHQAVAGYYQQLAGLIAERESAGAVVHAECLREEYPEGTDTPLEQQHEVFAALRRQGRMIMDQLHALGLDLISQAQGLPYDDSWREVDVTIGDLAELNTLSFTDPDVLERQLQTFRNMSALARWAFSQVFVATLYKGFDRVIATGGTGGDLADDLVSHWRSVNAVIAAHRQMRLGASGGPVCFQHSTTTGGCWKR